MHPLTGPVEVAEAEPGDILEVEVLDVAPLVDFGYVVIGPALGQFGSLRPDLLAPITQFTEASEISDPRPGPVPGAIPEDQPYNSGSPFVQLFTFERGCSTGFATFVGADTGRRARIPVAPFMGIYGVAPMRKGMYRTLPPSVSGGTGGDAGIRQFTRGATRAGARNAVRMGGTGRPVRRPGPAADELDRLGRLVRFAETVTVRWHADGPRRVPYS